MTRASLRRRLVVVTGRKTAAVKGLNIPQRLMQRGAQAKSSVEDRSTLPAFVPVCQPFLSSIYGLLSVVEERKFGGANLQKPPSTGAVRSYVRSFSVVLHLYKGNNLGADERELMLPY